MSVDDPIRLDGVRVLLVDDEPNMLRVVRRILKRRGADVQSAYNGAEALPLLEEFEPDIVLSDLTMPEMDGITFLREINKRDVDPIVIVLTGQGTMETAIEAMRLGARDYLQKPCDPDEILLVFQREIDARRTRHENVRLKTELSSLSRRLEQYESYGEMIGHSKPMQDVYRQIDRLCKFHDMTVLVVGETGTGKELVARALHQKSPRAPHPFIAINCGAIPSELQESQLFGHRRGSFTGALDDHVGAFKAAHQGTLLLDEVGDMRPELQVKLLRALEERTITPLGHLEPQKIDVRVVTATNRDLHTAVEHGDFRADLYNRIEGAVIHLPPLRERVEDIPALAQHFLENLARDYKVRPKELADGAVERLQDYHWPGNVRELQNVINRSFVFTTGDVIDADDLDIDTRQHAPTPQPAPRPEPVLADGANGDGDGDGDDDLGALERQERDMIVRALEQTKGNKSKAAELLGIDRKRLYRRLRKYDIG